GAPISLPFPRFSESRGGKVCRHGCRVKTTGGPDRIRRGGQHRAARECGRRPTVGAERSAKSHGRSGTSARRTSTMSRINTNVQSLIAQRTLSQNNCNLSQSLERLSTGLRINRGKDDPAGLIASQRLDAEAKSLNQAIAN